MRRFVLIPLALFWLVSSFVMLRSVAANVSGVPAPALVNWTETWPAGDLSKWTVDLTPWQPGMQTCFAPNGQTVMAVCSASALRSIQTWNPAYPWTMEWRMRAKAEAKNTQYGYDQFNAAGGWWHCDDDCGANYATANVEQQVPPWWGGPYLAWLGYGVDIYGAYVPWTWNTWRVEWKPDKQQTWAYLDGRRVGKYKARPQGPMRAMALCVSIGSGYPGDGSSSRCEFGPLQIIGTPL